MTRHALPGTRPATPHTLGVDTQHRAIGRHRCTCGWEGDHMVTHLADVARNTPSPANPVGRTQLIRDALGRAHYERMASGFAAGGMRLPGWDDLREGTRESYRARLDYVLPRLDQALDALHLLGGTA